jgi:cytoskeleton protein RodZ
MNEEAQGVGATLRAAREARGWTTNDVAGRLRLMARQIEAIENEDFAKLGHPVFARGFVRNYAKLLGMEPDELLGQMTRVRIAPPQEEVESVPFAPAEGFWKSPWVWIAAAVAVVVIAIPVGLYLWLSGGEEEHAAPAVEQAVPPPPPPPAPVLETPPAAPAEAAPAAPEAGKPSSAPAAAAPAAAQPPAAPAPAPQVAMPAPAAAVPARAPAPLPPPPAATPPAVPPPVPAKPVVAPAVPAQSGAVRLQFDEAAWVQVRDSTGRTMHSGLSPAGTMLDLSGKAPFYLVVGNAAHVRVSYKGQPVDIRPFIDVTVARFTLNP